MQNLGFRGSKMHKNVIRRAITVVALVMLAVMLPTQQAQAAELDCTGITSNAPQTIVVADEDKKTCVATLEEPDVLVQNGFVIVGGVDINGIGEYSYVVLWLWLRP